MAGVSLGREEGLVYLIRSTEGLSSGLFADMRETRAGSARGPKARRCSTRSPIPAASALAATAGGAARALNLDLSRNVLAWGQENYRLNGFEPDPHDFVFGDVFDWLARFARRGETFDLVILDPPSFSKTKTGRFSAAKDYAQLAEWRRRWSRRAAGCWRAATWPNCRGARSGSACWRG